MAVGAVCSAGDLGFTQTLRAWLEKLEQLGAGMKHCVSDAGSLSMNPEFLQYPIGVARPR